MLTAVILTKNEAQNIERCLDSLSFCDRVLVIDDQSTDNTLEICKKRKIQVISHKLSNDWSQQRNFALSKCTAGWVLFVDADEVISNDLAEEIKNIISQKNNTNSYAIKRVDTIWNHEFKYGDNANQYFTRLARTKDGKWKGKVHEKWITNSEPIKMKNPILHYPHQSVVEFLEHINWYSNIKANELYEQKKAITIFHILGAPIIRFVKNYIFKLGFLDGTPGTIHAVMMSFYAFLVCSKTFLLYKGIPAKK